VLLGLLGAIGTPIFVTIMDWGTTQVWPEPPGVLPFSGSWRIVVILTAAGLLVGLIHRFTYAEEVVFVGAIFKGRLDPGRVRGTLLASLVTLIGGFSLSPGVPCGILAGGLATWMSEWRKLGEEVQHSNVLSSIIRAFGRLFTTPFAFLIMPLELPHRQQLRYYGTVVIGGAAAVLGFALFCAISGDRSSDLLRFLDLPGFDLRVWHLGVAVLLGIAQGSRSPLQFMLLLSTIYAVSKTVHHTKHLGNRFDCERKN
jgi:H+/Cl- antiporter ClcA